MDKTERRLCGIFICSLLMFAYVVGNYVQTRNRINDQLHALTNESMVPPSTINVKTN